jgi:hypothetical protein
LKEEMNKATLSSELIQKEIESTKKKVEKGGRGGGGER